MIAREICYSGVMDALKLDRGRKIHLHQITSSLLDFALDEPLVCVPQVLRRSLKIMNGAKFVNRLAGTVVFQNLLVTNIPFLACLRLRSRCNQLNHRE
jgi:hypothetical protein